MTESTTESKTSDLLRAWELAEKINEWRHDDEAGTEAASMLLFEIEQYLGSLAGWLAHPTYSVINPSPGFCYWRDMTLDDPLFPLIVLREADVICFIETDAARGRFCAIGPNFETTDEPGDYCYGDGSRQAIEAYREQARAAMQERAKANFISSDKRLSIAREIYAEHDQAVENLHRAIGMGGHFQDEDGVVYLIEPQVWMKVKVKPITVNRTRREGERAGELSMTRARELGYTVEGEAKKAPKQQPVIAESALINGGATTK